MRQNTLKQLYAIVAQHRIWVIIMASIVLVPLSFSAMASDSDQSKDLNYKSFDCEKIQKAIDDLSPSESFVKIKEGTYTCRMPVIIDRDNVDLRGMGSNTILRLADGANSPVLLIGGTGEIPTVSRSSIHVSDLVIDGNRENQTTECWSGTCDTGGLTVIRNNGITLRHVNDVLIERVTVKKARSGGLVSEKNNQHVTVRDFTSFDNYFDGLAAYETENSMFSHLYLYDNLAAGFSFDIGFNNNIVDNVIIERSGSVGIFMRDSKDNLFDGFQIRNSTEHGIFLAQVGSDITKPASGNTFNGFIISGSGGAGIRVNDASDVNNLVIGSQFVGNTGGCISEAVPGLVQTAGIICR